MRPGQEDPQANQETDADPSQSGSVRLGLLERLERLSQTLSLNELADFPPPLLWLVDRNGGERACLSLWFDGSWRLEVPEKAVTLTSGERQETG